MFNRFAAYFLTTKLWRKLATHIVAHFTFRTFGYPKFPMDGYYQVMKILKDAASSQYHYAFAFVCTDRDALAWKIQNFVTKAQWGHAGLVVFDLGKIYDVGGIRAIHMKGNGLNDWSLLDLLRECDDFALIRIPLFNGDCELEVDRRLYEVRNADTCEYDFSMELDQVVLDWLNPRLPNELPVGKKKFKMYCSEFVYALFRGVMPLGRGLTARQFRDRAVFEPDDLYKQGEVVFQHVSRR